MKPQQRTPFDAPFMVLLWALTFVVAEGLAVQVGGQVASWVFGGHRPVFGAIGTGTVVFGRLVHHLGDPKLAWSPADRPSLPGPVAMWASLLVTQLVLVGLVVVTVRLVRHFGSIGKPTRRSGESQSGPRRAAHGSPGGRAPHRRPLREGRRIWARATGPRDRRRHRRPAVRQVRGLHPRRRRAPGRQRRGVRDPGRAPAQGSGGGDRHPP